jgi:hypothetical protein
MTEENYDNVRQDIHCPERQSNRTPPIYKSEWLSPEVTSSVSHECFVLSGHPEFSLVRRIDSLLLGSSDEAWFPHHLSFLYSYTNIFDVIVSFKTEHHKSNIPELILFFCFTVSYYNSTAITAKYL